MYSAHENNENVVTTGVHLIIKVHTNHGVYNKLFQIIERYKRLHPSRANEIDKVIEERNPAKFSSMVFAICHDLGVKKPRFTREYVYLAHSYRKNGKVKKVVRYVGPTHEKLSMKDLVYLMTGTTNFKDVDGWREESEYHKWPSLHKVPGLNLGNAMRYLLEHIGFAPCASDYIIQHGYPTTFKELFDKHGLTELLTREAIRHAQTRLTSVWQEPTKYYSGTLEEVERVKQFLVEHHNLCQHSNSRKVL